MVSIENAAVFWRFFTIHPLQSHAAAAEIRTEHPKHQAEDPDRRVRWRRREAPMGSDPPRPPPGGIPPVFQGRRPAGAV